MQNPVGLKTGIFFFVLSVFKLGQALQDPFLLEYPHPLSRLTGAFGNPAGLWEKDGSLTLLGVTLRDNQEFHDAFVNYNWDHTALAYRYSDRLTESEITLSQTFPVGSNASLGAKINRNWWEGGQSWAFDFGFQWAPSSLWKIGYYTNEFWMDFRFPGSRPTHLASLGIRPLAFFKSHNWGGLATLSIDHIYRGFDSDFWDGRQQYFTGSLNLIKGIKVQGRISLDEPEDYSLGISFQTNAHGFIGYHQTVPQKGEFRSQIIDAFHSKSQPKSLSLPGEAVILDLNREIVEGEAENPWYNPSRKLGHMDVINRLREIQSISGIRMLVLKMGRVRCSFATGAHIRSALLDLKKSGIEIIAFMEVTSEVAYYLASAADKIAMPPTSYFDVQGFGTEVTLFKGLLDKIGVQAQFIRKGEYKSYPEAFTRDSMSTEWSSNMKSVFEDLWTGYLTDIGASRNISVDSLRSIFSTPDISIARAIETGIIDTAMYGKDLSHFLLKNRYKVYKPFYAGNRQENWNSGPTIGRINIDGMIVHGRSQEGNFVTGTTTGAESVIRQIRRAKNSPGIKALVVRINSPGGSAVASDIIYQELMNYRKSLKPLIISVGSVCASGGYYIASAGDMIIVEKSSVVGSIGIFGGKFIVKDLYEKLGLKSQTIKTAPYADAKSPQRPWSEAEEKAIQSYMDNFYQTFLEIVEKSRKISTDSLSHLAEGRIFTGSQAVSNGLADRLGNFESATTVALFKLGYKGDHPFVLKTLESGDKWLPQEQIIPTISQKSPLEEIAESLTEWNVLNGKLSLWALSPECFYLIDF